MCRAHAPPHGGTEYGDRHRSSSHRGYMTFMVAEATRLPLRYTAARAAARAGARAMAHKPRQHLGAHVFLAKTENLFRTRYRVVAGVMVQDPLVE